MSAPTWTIEQWVEHGRAWRSLGWAPSSGSWGSILIGRRGDYTSKHGASLRQDGTVYSDYFVEWVPDMRDPGTRGHALALVREAWGDEFAQAIHDGSGWRLVGALEYRGLYGFPSEAVALLAAREAAP